MTTLYVNDNAIAQSTFNDSKRSDDDNDNDIDEDRRNLLLAMAVGGTSSLTSSSSMTLLPSSKIGINPTRRHPFVIVRSLLRNGPGGAAMM